MINPKKSLQKFKLNGILIQLLVSYLILLVFVGAVFLGLNQIYRKNLEEEIISRNLKIFDNDIKELEDYINKLLIDYYIDFTRVYDDLVGNRKVKMSDFIMLYDSFKYNDLHDVKIHILFRDFDYILSNEGSFHTSDIYKKFYKNNQYSVEFWMNELNKDFIHKIYSVQNYREYMSVNKSNSLEIIPIAFKYKLNSPYIYLILVNANKYFSNITNKELNNVILLNENNEIIYSSQQASFDKNILDNVENKVYKDKEFIYIIGKSPTLGFTYIHKTNKNVAFSNLNKLNNTFFIMLGCLVLIFVFISIVFSRIFNNPIIRIKELIMENVNNDKNAIFNMGTIANSYFSLCEANKKYKYDIEENNSVIEQFYIQKLTLNNQKDNNVLTKLFNNPFFNTGFFIIITKAHKADKELFDENEFYFYLLINKMIGDFFASCDLKNITFLNEHNIVISIVNTKNDLDNTKDIMSDYINFLVKEKSMTYFTTIYSKKCTNINLLNTIYNNNLNKLKYRKLNQETQVYFEDDLIITNEKLDFSQNVKDKLSKQLLNGNIENSLNLIAKLVNYSIKEGNSHDVYLLCVNIIYFCNNLILAKKNHIHETFTNYNYYDKLLVFDYRDEYLEFLEDLLKTTIRFLTDEKDDPIVEYVKKMIEEKYNKHVSLCEIADKINISRSYLTTYFKEKSGTTLIDYLNRYRIEMSIPYFSSDMKVKDIPAKVGINNMSTYIRLFRKYKNCTPKEYRIKISIRY